MRQTLLLVGITADEHSKLAQTLSDAPPPIVAEVLTLKRIMDRYTGKPTDHALVGEYERGGRRYSLYAGAHDGRPVETFTELPSYEQLSVVFERPHV
jgi:hypothetical protein